MIYSWRCPLLFLFTLSGLSAFGEAFSPVVVTPSLLGGKSSSRASPSSSYSSSYGKILAQKNDEDSSSKVDMGFNLLGLASAVVPQGRIVQTAKESWKFVWKRMMTELAPQDQTGNYQRPKYGFSSTLGSRQHDIDDLSLGGNNNNNNNNFPRYQVYVGNPCPWCHRVRLVANLLHLVDASNNDPVLGMTLLVDDPIKASRGGWVFPALAKFPPGVPPLADLRGLYDYLSPGYQGRCTAPLLVDWKTKQIVSNESSDIVRMLPLLWQGKNQNEKTLSSKLDLCPAEYQDQIEETNEWVYRLLNNGVYRCGFSTSQQAYQRASQDVLQGLEKCQDILSKQDYLVGNKLTESDVMLLPTMLRFDGVYAPLFRAGGTQLRLECDYPAIYQWLKRCWAIDGVATSIELEDACGSYYRQLFPLNPGGILPTPITPQSLRLE